MRTSITRHLSFANVAAMTALVVALSGTAYAAGLGPDTVGSKQIKNGSVKSADIKNGSLKGLDVDESTLEQVDAATLNGWTPETFARGAGRKSGAFTGSLEVTVAGYGSYGLSCDGSGEVHYSGSVAPLGAGAREFVSMDWTDGPYTTAGTSTQVFEWDGLGSGSGTSVDGGARFHVRTLVQNAAETKALIVEGWGTKDGSGCYGHVETWIAQ